MIARTIMIIATFVFTAPARAQVIVGPVSIEREILGQSVSVPFTALIEATRNAGSVTLEVILEGDLTDLQSKFNAIARSIPLPQDNCPREGTHTLSVIEDAALQPAGTTAVIRVRARATVWQCASNPIPSCTVFMGQQCVDLGPFGRPCTDVPQTRCEPGSPIKTILVQEGFWGDLPMTLTTRDQRSLDIVPGSPDIHPRGDLGRFINDLARLFNSDLNPLAQRELDKLVDSASLRMILPPGVSQYDLLIQDASFTASGDRLGVRARLTASISDNQLNDYLQQLLSVQAGHN
jgi:hypothetical protein